MIYLVLFQSTVFCYCMQSLLKRAVMFPVSKCGNVSESEAQREMSVDIIRY